ncbi:uncharacterized protein Z518_06200 [Rhinocladiella mackenziei CBS 650.93]|uniref:Srp40 C-terminal domain-containing protein n=1 Tax=Rhinocladiella mackenziei CBS 650.93 TaxID=1442369 RepID=A0A0D2H4H9_9EURO|nr:uncharacterized protein Z518_06200 [Rhinocladiella mackenziei CBS 650.93]KIX05328.1 hypothetical protein Z518_06200 [Rhinocladiella mackenziei CBS 650.93]
MTAKNKGSQGSGTGPSPQLLALVLSFLTDNGLEHTKKAFTRELQRLQDKFGWSTPESVQEGVSLQMIVESWKQNGASSPDLDSESDVTSSEGESSSNAVRDEDTSSDDSSESEEEVTVSKSKRNKSKRRSLSPSSSSSDSDADDEEEDGVEEPFTKPGKQALAHEPAVKNTLKRKAESSSSESSSSDSDSDSPDDDRRAKRARIAEGAVMNDIASSEGSASDSQEESDENATTASSESEEEEEESDVDDPPVNGTKMDAESEAPSDSSGTVVGDNLEAAKSSDSEDVADEKVEPATKHTKTPAMKKKHVGAKPTPLAQLSAQAIADSHISNAYRSYGYADRAYKDLSVTRGKGFTKEKNKKKRGSYRGGAIDISGGKGFKFDD